MGIMIELEAYCTCGEELEVTYTMKNDILVMEVEPCDCNFKDGKEEGHDEGYDEGYDKGLMAAEEEWEKERTSLLARLTELEDMLADIEEDDE